MTFHLTVSLAGSGYHPASWQVSPLPPVPDAAAFRAMARTAERGKLDAVLLGLPVTGADASNGINTMSLDPLPLIGALIAATERVGLGMAYSLIGPRVPRRLVNPTARPRATNWRKKR